MTIWAMGRTGARARFIEASRPEEILGYMEDGDQCAPVSVEDKERGGMIVGAMQFRPFTDEELAEQQAVGSEGEMPLGMDATGEQ